MVETLIEVCAYSALGIVLMGLASWIFDLIVPYDFQSDIADGNKAAAWVCASVFMGIGFLLRTIIADAPALASPPLLEGVVETAIWSAVA